MKQQDQNARDDCRRTTEIMISRRLAVGSSALAVLGLLSRSAFGQAEGKTSDSGGMDSRTPASNQNQDRMDETRAFMERMRNASTSEERAKIMMELSTSGRQRAVAALKDQLGVSDKEWSVIKPRLEAVYDLVHPIQQPAISSGPPATELEQKSKDLRELLNDKEAATEQIKTRLAALRAAKEKANQDLAKARQGLRQVVTLRQEALLVLNGLLD